VETRLAPVPGIGDHRPSMAPDDALRRLLEGNRRHAHGAHRRPRCDPATRVAFAAGQRPWVAVLGCADSRVPPEIVFDQGLGDLFVVRTAGHVADAVVLASLRYAVEHLNVPLVVVLGHSGCGAVQVTLKHGPEDREDPLSAAIRPAVEAVRGSPGDLCERTVRLHVGRTAAEIREGLGAGGQGASVVGAVYDLGSGLAEFLH